VEVTDSATFVAMLSEKLLAGYKYRTSAEVAATVKAGSSNLIGDNLLGSISEFAVYVIRCVQGAISYPFIHCFRAPDPLGSANFPLVDISFFRPKRDSTKDRLYMQEVKASRDNPQYFGACEDDFHGLYATSRLASTVEHLKWDLQHAKKKRMVSRVNDCLGTCPADSVKVRLVPTGVSGDAAEKSKCVRKIEAVVSNLRTEGWPSVRGMYLRVPAIEKTYRAFACGEGCGS
jgi:hypothetical protein